MMSFDIGKVRAALDLTQPKFAELVGVHWTSVASWEAGRATPREPTRRYIETLLKERGFDPSDYIIAGKRTKRRSPLPTTNSHI